MPRWAKIALPIGLIVLLASIVGEGPDDADVVTTATTSTLVLPTVPRASEPASTVPATMATTTTAAATTALAPTTTTRPPATTATTAAPQVATTAPPPRSSCHPSYEGACVPADASDVDCAGGTGNGPAYVGRVRVVGPDVYDLDRDGNGIGCEN